MSLPFSVSLDPQGNLYMQDGTIITLGSTTGHFVVRGVAGLPVTYSIDPSSNLPISTGFHGGSGQNVIVDPSPLGTLVPDGFFRPTEPNLWGATGGITMTFDPGTGGATIDDATGTVATLPSGSATTAPYGTFNSTTYGATTYNGGTAFTVPTTYEGGPTYPTQGAIVNAQGTTIQEGSYARTGWQTWESIDDPNWTITLDGTGAGVVNDGTDDVMTRAASAGQLYDPTSGGWESTTYGETTYNGGTFFYGGVVIQRSHPIAGYLFVTLALNANDEVTGVTGPFFDSSLPSNSATEVSVPIAYSDGLGTVTQIQLGPIIWRPNP